MSDAADLKPTFNRSEMLRLWKGLHYCFWMSDKPLVQEELAEKIASLIHCFKVQKKWLFSTKSETQLCGVLTGIVLNHISK
jgi:hypothetical protein